MQEYPKWCSSCFQNLEHCQCSHGEVETLWEGAQLEFESMVNDVSEDTIKRIKENRSRATPHTKRYWDGFTLQEFRGISIQDPTRALIIKEYPND